MVTLFLQYNCSKWVYRFGTLQKTALVSEQACCSEKMINFSLMQCGLKFFPNLFICFCYEIQLLEMEHYFINIVAAASLTVPNLSEHIFLHFFDCLLFVTRQWHHKRWPSNVQ